MDMKQYSLPILIGAGIVAMMIAMFLIGDGRGYRRMAGELEKYQNNIETLMGDVEHYKIQDSLNVARVQSLELTLDEFKRFRAEDAALIKQLKNKNRDLQSVVTTQQQTMLDLQAVPRDTVIIRDSVKIGALALHCGDQWYDFDGILTDKDFTGNVIMRDSLLVAETVRYKRFLGFLWKTHKVQNRMLDVISKNPHTVIQDCELVTIEE